MFIFCRRDLFGEYPNGLYPTTFFVWKDYFVALPVPDSRMMNVSYTERLTQYMGHPVS